MSYDTKKEIERQDAIHRIAQNRENELRVLHAIERGPIEMSGNQPIAAQFRYREAIELIVHARRSHRTGTDQSFQELVNGLTSRLGNVQKNDAQRRLHMCG